MELGLRLNLTQLTRCKPKSKSLVEKRKLQVRWEMNLSKRICLEAQPDKSTPLK